MLQLKYTLKRAITVFFVAASLLTMSQAFAAEVKWKMATSWEAVR